MYISRERDIYNLHVRHFSDPMLSYISTAGTATHGSVASFSCH